MRIARMMGGNGPELALVEADGLTWQRTGIAADRDWLSPETLQMAAASGVQREPVEPAQLLSPVVPRTIVGVRLNNRAHAAEQGKALPERPTLFLKHPRGLARPSDALPLHPASDQMDYEAELGIVIGHDIFARARAEAEAAIAGWVVVQDFTVRDLARPETLTIAKGGRGMAPIGPWLTTTTSVTIAAANQVTIRCWVNGELRQSACTADMHFKPVDLVLHVSRYLPLGPGDVIASGSPSGSGVGVTPPRWLTKGDVIDTEITGLGRLRQQATGPA